VSDLGEAPLYLGDVVNIIKSCCNKEPVPPPQNYLEAFYMNICYKDCEAIGGYIYFILLVDKATIKAWI